MTIRTVIYNDGIEGLYEAWRRGRVVVWRSAAGRVRDAFPTEDEAAWQVRLEKARFDTTGLCSARRLGRRKEER